MRVECCNFETNKIVVCVRNPFDVIISLTNFLNLFSHAKEMENRPEVDDPEFFDQWVKFTVNMFKEFQEQLFKQLKDKKVPMLFFKFEYLRKNPQTCLTDLFKYLLNQESLEGTFCEARIEEIVNKGHGATQVYKVKKSDGKFNAIDRFTPE